MILSSALVIVGFINCLLGLIVLSRNFKLQSNIVFWLFASSVGGWSIGLGGFTATSDETIALVWGKVFYVAAALIAVFLLLFAASFPSKKLGLGTLVLIISPAAVLSGLIIFWPAFLLGDINYQSWGKEIELDSLHYLLYSAYFVIYQSSALLIIFNKLKSSNSHTKQQLKYVLSGILIASIFGVIFNLILPWFDNYRLVWVGPLFSVTYVMLISLAIVKYKLFDLRLIVARATAYILVVSALLLLFVSSGLLLSNLALEDASDLQQNVFYFAFSIVAALTFPPLRRLFDRLTNLVFHRDTYSTEKVLDTIGQIVITDIETKKLFSESLFVLRNALKPSAIHFSLSVDNNHEYIFKDKMSPKKSKSVKADLYDTLAGQKNRVHYIDDSPATEEFNQKLNKHDIVVSVILETEGEVVGHILLGHKLTGDNYTSQDINLLNIVANELAIAIQNAQRFEEIKEFNIKLQREIEKATKDLRSSNSKLKALDEAKDEFISMASHQLRTPLTSVKGYVSMVIEGDVGKVSTKQKELLSEAFASSQRMVYLIADLLNMSRLKTGKFVIDKTKIDLPEVVEEEISQLYETAKARKIHINYNKPIRFPKLYLDDTKIRQVIMNFADNAVYYTPPGGHIDIQIKAKKHTIEYLVIDDGIGVKKEDQKRMFTKFFRASNAKKARPDGTGLGLYMAKKVVDAHGGTVIFKSKENQGSTFGFSFPKEKIVAK